MGTEENYKINKTYSQTMVGRIVHFKNTLAGIGGFVASTGAGIAFGKFFGNVDPTAVANSEIDNGGAFVVLGGFALGCLISAIKAYPIEKRNLNRDISYERGVREIKERYQYTRGIADELLEKGGSKEIAERLLENDETQKRSKIVNFSDGSRYKRDRDDAKDFINSTNVSLSAYQSPSVLPDTTLNDNDMGNFGSQEKNKIDIIPGLFDSPTPRLNRDLGDILGGNLDVAEAVKKGPTR